MVAPKECAACSCLSSSWPSGPAASRSKPTPHDLPKDASGAAALTDDADAGEDTDRWGTVEPGEVTAVRPGEAPERRTSLVVGRTRSCVLREGRVAPR